MKKTVRLTESMLISIIKKMVTEQLDDSITSDTLKSIGYDIIISDHQTFAKKGLDSFKGKQLKDKNLESTGIIYQDAKNKLIKILQEKGIIPEPGINGFYAFKKTPNGKIIVKWITILNT